MSVVMEARVSAADFELGRLFDAGMGPDAVVELETVVPVGDETVPYFRVLTDRVERFLEAVREDPIVDRARVVDEFGEQSLIAFDWEWDRDPLFSGVFRSGVAVLSARGGERTWTFEFRFDDDPDLEAFREHCEATGVGLEVVRVCNSVSRGADLSLGVTTPQQEALTLAVERGYYDVPRRCTTADLAAGLGISDQAVSERLRRGVATLVEHTLRPGSVEGA